MSHETPDGQAYRDRAFSLIQRGFFIIPVNPLDRHPYTPHGYKDASNDPAVIERWWQDHPDAIPAIVPGRSGHTITDLDRKNGVDGFQSLQELEAQYGLLPPTAAYATQHDGEHRVLLGTRETCQGIRPGIDLISDWGYAVAWQDLPETTIADAPAWLLTLGKLPAEQQSSKQTEDHKERLSPPSHRVKEGEGRNVAVTKHAGYLRGMHDMPYPSLLACLAAFNQETCIPPLDAKELARIARSAMNFSPGKEFPPDVTEALTSVTNNIPLQEHEKMTIRIYSRTTSNQYRISNYLKSKGALYGSDFRNMIEEQQTLSQPYSLADLAAMETQHPQEYLVDGLLATGSLFMFAAKPKAGKSCLLRNLMASLITGTEFLGRKVKQTDRIIYFCLEEQLISVAPQFSRLGCPPSDTGLTVYDGKTTLQGMLETMERHVEENKPDLVCVDPLIAVTGDVDTNNYGEVYASLSPFIHFAHTHRVAVVAVHHCIKDGRGELTLDSLMGSAAYGAAVDGALLMMRDKKDIRWVASDCRDPRDTPLKKAATRLDRATLRVTLAAEDVHDPRRHAALAKVVRLLQADAEDGLVSPTELANALKGEGWGNMQKRQAMIKEAIAAGVLTVTHAPKGRGEVFEDV